MAKPGGKVIQFHTARHRLTGTQHLRSTWDIRFALLTRVIDLPLGSRWGRQEYSSATSRTIRAHSRSRSG